MTQWDYYDDEITFRCPSAHEFLFRWHPLQCFRWTAYNFRDRNVNGTDIAPKLSDYTQSKSRCTAWYVDDVAWLVSELTFTTTRLTLTIHTEGTDKIYYDKYHCVGMMGKNKNHIKSLWGITIELLHWKMTLYNLIWKNLFLYLTLAAFMWWRWFVRAYLHSNVCACICTFMRVVCFVCVCLCLQ